MDRAIPLFHKRGNLLAGLLLIVFVAAGPALAVLFNFQRDQQQERQAQASTIALQRADLVSASVGSIVEGTRQMMVTLSATQRVQKLRPECGALLDDLRRGTPAYAVLAVVRPDGEPVCSSTVAPLPPQALGSLVRPFLAARGFIAGRFTRLPDPLPAVLGFALPFSGHDGSGPALLIAGLDLRYFGTALEALHQPSDGRLAIADPEGTVLASVPANRQPAGSKLRQTAILLDKAVPGVALLHNPDGSPRAVGYVPPGANATGLFVTASFNVADLITGIDLVAERGYLLSALGAALSLLLALFIGHRTLAPPPRRCSMRPGVGGAGT